MSKLEPCPFECVMIISDGFKGWSNIIHAKTGIPLAMANPMMTRAFKTLIKVWDTRQPVLSLAGIWKVVNEIDSDIDDYELRADEGDYAPNDHEKILINDYSQGLLEEVVQAIFNKLRGE